MKEIIETLEYAISDIGVWSWWAEKLPNVFQIEFRSVMLWNPPVKEGNPPSGQIAIRFLQPKHISFNIRKSQSKIYKNWYALLHEDKIEPFSIDCDAFTINNKERAKEILSQIEHTDLFFGESINELLFDSKFFMCFWAGDVGTFICAEDIEVLNHAGKIELSEIQDLSNKWWSYWREYYNCKGTENEMPFDFACEVTIPIKGE